MTHPLCGPPEHRCGANGLYPGDRIVYALSGKTGVMDEALQGGEALVTWDDGTYDIVYWIHLLRDQR